MPISTLNNFAARMRQWQARNPLQVYRKQNKYTIATLAVMFATNSSTIQSWLYGSASPMDASLAMIERVTNDSQMGDKLREWKASAPTP